ncbi:biosynthetic peptidoglycan transglycosylase [Lujinxingia litoralis]|nr:biosynthetic peptidoglycan transglycosylase [Lujinxingia litoralis]
MRALKTEGKERRQGARRISVALVLLALFGVLCGVLWELARSPTVLGRLIAPKIARVARQQGVDLEVAALGPAGWTGVRAYQVQVGLVRGGQRVETSLERVDLYLDWGETLRSGVPKLGRMELGAFEFGVVRVPQVELKPPVQDEIDRSLEASVRPGVSTSGSGEKVGALERFVASELEVSWSGGPVRLQQGIGPVELDAGRITLDVPGRRIASLRGEGRVAGQRFGLQGHDRTLSVISSAIDLPELFHAPAGALKVERVDLELEGLLESAGRSDAPMLVTLRGLEARVNERADAVLRAERSTLERRGPTLSWHAEGAQVEGAQKTYGLRDVAMSYRADVPGIGLQAEVLDGEGGHLNVEAQWHLPSAMVGINAWFHEFTWDGTTPWPVPGSSRVTRARLEGTLHGELDLAQRIADLNGELGVSDLRVEAPFLASDTLVFDRLEMGLGLTFDVASRALSVGQGRLKLGALDPVRWSGHVIDAGRGFSFGWTLAGEDLDASQVLSELPDAMTGILAQTKMSGRFGVKLGTSGHSAYPESLMLDVGFSGDVAVKDSLRWSAMRAAGADVPEGEQESAFFDSDAHPARQMNPDHWARLARLPDHVPAALLSAEDATFLQHEGLDWVGLRMAMVHNLREGALERGGSTITQQLAKNLFLTHDRTISRKLQEAFLTWRMESELSKEKILELYINVVDWGPGVHGLYQASRYYFERDPDQLTLSQSAMLGAILPGPAHYGAMVKAGYLPSSRQDKMRRVLVNMRFLEQLTWPQYHAALDEVNRSSLGGVQLAVCADDESAPEGARACADVLREDARDAPGEMSFEEQEAGEIPAETGWVPLTH